MVPTTQFVVFFIANRGLFEPVVIGFRMLVNRNYRDVIRQSSALPIVVSKTRPTDSRNHYHDLNYIIDLFLHQQHKKLTINRNLYTSNIGLTSYRIKTTLSFLQSPALTNRGTVLWQNRLVFALTTDTSVAKRAVDDGNQKY